MVKSVINECDNVSSNGAIDENNSHDEVVATCSLTTTTTTSTTTTNNNNIKNHDINSNNNCVNAQNYVSDELNNSVQEQLKQQNEDERHYECHSNETFDYHNEQPKTNNIAYMILGEAYSKHDSNLDSTLASSNFSNFDLSSSDRTKSSDYENLKFFNNLSDNNKIENKNDEIDERNANIIITTPSTSSTPSSLIENAECIVEIPLDSTKMNVACDENGEIEINFVESNNTAAQFDVDQNQVKNENDTVDHCHASNANSNFSLIKDEYRVQKKFFNSRGDVFLKPKKSKNNLKLCSTTVNANPIKINKMLLFLALFSIILFIASVCYIVISHFVSANNFKLTTPIVYKQESLLLAPIEVNIEVISF